MIVEFEKTIIRLDREIKELEDAGHSESKAYWMLQGAKGQAEKFYSFYKTQMIAKDRIKPEKQEEASNA